MNYAKLYDSIVNNAKCRGLRKSKLYFITERHHIVPECIGGLNEKSNYVLLKLKEHIICHHLLCKIYPENDSLAYAYFMMLHTRDDKFLLSAKQYEDVKARVSSARIGHIVTNETRDKIRNARLGQSPWNTGLIGVQTAWNKGSEMKQSTKDKMRVYAKTRKLETSSNKVACKIDDVEFHCLKSAIEYAKNEYGMNNHQTVLAFSNPMIENFIKFRIIKSPKNSIRIIIDDKEFCSKRLALFYVKASYNIGGTEFMKRLGSNEWPNWKILK